MVLPIMVSRLMFSLKKVVDKGAGPWTMSTMGDSRGGRSQEGGNLSFASRRFDASHETSGTLASLNEEVVELDSVHRSPRDHRLQQQC